MNRLNSGLGQPAVAPARRIQSWRRFPARCRVVFLAGLVCALPGLAGRLAAAPDSAATASLTNAENPAPRFNVRGYVIGGNLPLAANTLAAIFSRHTGTNLDVQEIVKAAAAVQAENLRQGNPPVSVAVMPEQITDGIVTLNIFQAAYPQIVVSGQRYLDTGELAEATLPAIPPALPGELSAPPVAATTAAPPAPSVKVSATPATPEEMASARAALLQALADLAAREKDTRIHVVDTNTGPHFDVAKYLVLNNSVLTPRTIAMTLTNIDGAFGTNVSMEGIRTVLAQLQAAYRERGYVTVSVGLPQQKLTNATVKVQVTEGRLADIQVKGNNYFSSNNVMRTLPSLHNGTILNGLIFQAELNRANANRDRQIYPVISPGPEPGTSELTLNVRDQLPLHGKLELNDQSSPGTPALRVNTSAEADNLWQLEHSLGVQYSFSPEQFKDGSQWDFYDRPSVANYSAFYRLPLGSPEPVDKLIAERSGSFGYNEATRRFDLPPLSAGPSLTFYGSRSTIDNGVATLSSQNLYTTNGNSLDLTTVQQDSTINSDGGFRISLPLQTGQDFHSILSAGSDYKQYGLSSGQTNIFTLIGTETLYNPPRTNIVISKSYSPVPFTVNQLDYVPLALGYNAGWQDSLGAATLGLDFNANLWYSSQTSFASTATNGRPVITYLNGAKSLQSISGSAKTTGHWVVLRPSFSQEIVIHTNWVATLRADGQWASEPLISNEQFGLGGVNSVRGYSEGEVFGDAGWHVSLEQQTPPHLVGVVNGNLPLTIRGSVYMDLGTVYLLDPQGRPDHTTLWGTGVGLAASLGPHWQSRFLFSLPLTSTTLTPSYAPRFNFVLTAQF